MQIILKISLCAWCLGVTHLVTAQSTGGKTPATRTTSSKSTTAAKPKTTATKTAPVSYKELTITLKNKCEKTVGIYTGPKEGIRHPKMKTVGGLSTNTIYIKPYEVVCIMNAAGKMTACYSIKPGTTYIEINSSATGLTGK